MKRPFITFAISGLTWISIGQCLGDDAQGFAGFILNPWATVLLLYVGMILLTTELMTLGSWGWTGAAGVVSLGLALSTHAFGGAPAWTGVLLMLVGFSLLFVESRIAPGYGISAVGGLVSLFIGCYWMLGAAAPIAFAIMASAGFTLLAAAAFLVHIPKNSAWQAIGRQLEITESRHRYMQMSEPVYVREDAETYEVAKEDVEASTEVEKNRQQRLGRKD